MTQPIILVVVLSLLVPLVPASSEGVVAPERPRYWPQVREARQWLKKQMPTSQFRCLHRLWERESSWRVKARNPYSGAYGIPQALPGRKMRSAGKDWRTSAMTQVKWGYKMYIKSRYGTPCKALRFQGSHGWY